MTLIRDVTCFQGEIPSFLNVSEPRSSLCPSHIYVYMSVCIYVYTDMSVYDMFRHNLVMYNFRMGLMAGAVQAQVG